MKQRSDPTTKPYYQCFLCPDFRTNCGGRPTRDMDIKCWCEYIRDTMDHFRLSNVYVAEKAKSSLKTTEKIRACSIDQDILRETARRYEMAVFGTAVRHICSRGQEIAAAEQVTALLEQVADLRAELNRKNRIIDKMLG